jgi:hypothetical protein
MIGSVRPQDTAQVRFAEPNEVVEGFATDRSDEPLDVAVLPRRAWRRRVIADSHCTNAMGVGWAEGPVRASDTKSLLYPFLPPLKDDFQDRHIRILDSGA